jgi:hypothetical protein
MKAIGYIATFLITTVFGSIWNGYVLAILWRWFVVKPFGAPALTVATAIGISLVVGYLTHQRQVDTDAEKAKSMEMRLMEALLWMLLKPAFALAVGAVVRNWV